MLRKSWLILSLLFSTGCVGPKITVCVVDVSGFQCHDERTNKSFVVAIDQASRENYVAMPSVDFGRLLDYAKSHCK